MPAVFAGPRPIWQAFFAGRPPQNAPPRERPGRPRKRHPRGGTANLRPLRYRVLCSGSAGGCPGSILLLIPMRLPLLAVAALAFLRIVCGLHFFLEGISHLRDPDWSSAGFRRAAVGPLADWARR